MKALNLLQSPNSRLNPCNLHLIKGQGCALPARSRQTGQLRHRRLKSSRVHDFSSTNELLDSDTAAIPTHLTSLAVENFALIDKQHIHLHPGLNVITGESGSGKSVFVEAIGQLLGAPAPDDAVRSPATSATLTGTFFVGDGHLHIIKDILSERGVGPKVGASLEGSHILTLRRDIIESPRGIRSRCSIDGTSVSLRTLREVGRMLVDFNGQNSSQSLSDPSLQLKALDDLLEPQSQNPHLIEAATRAWRELEHTRAQLAALDALGDEEERAALQEMVDQINGASISPGEDRELKRRLRNLEARRYSAEKCRLAGLSIAGDGSGGGGVLDALLDIERNIRSVINDEERLVSLSVDKSTHTYFDGVDGVDDVDASTDDDVDSEAADLAQAVEALHQAQHALEMAEDAVARYAKRYMFSQSEYDNLSRRLTTLQDLCRRHEVVHVDDLLEMSASRECQLDAYYQMEGCREELERSVTRLLREAQDSAVALSVARRKTSERLKEAVDSVLADLALVDAKFDVTFRWHAQDEEGGSVLLVSERLAETCGQTAGTYAVRPSGNAVLDSVEFLFASGQGESLKPLASVASGGESARILLALKAASSSWSSRGSSAQASVTVLDEIDSSIGARLGQPIGKILQRMGRYQQILCVSHIPQVAAHARHHVKVRKQRVGERLVTRFDILNDRERVHEVSAMLGLPLHAAEELFKTS